MNGLLPESISNTSHRLRIFSANGNKLSGQMHSAIGNLSYLNFLTLSSNMLMGEVPSSICSLNSLIFLDLSFNNFEGTLPDCLGNFSKTLAVLHLNANHFHGLIPTTFTKGCALLSLSLSSNLLEGTLPQSLSTCTQLEVLDVGNNKIQGFFPVWLETLSALRILSIASNKFHGTVLDSKRAIPLPKLRIFDISNNGFIGRLPTEYLKNFGHMNVRENTTTKKEGPNYVNISGSDRTVARSMSISITVTLKGVSRQLVKIETSSAMIDMSNNKFDGNIPHSFGHLAQLRHLNLSHNNLCGHIPETLGFLTKLEALDLSTNQLEGEIPWQLTKLTFLSTFNVSYNNLSGKILSGGQFSTFSDNSYMGNSGLCGYPLTEKCKDENKQAPPPPQGVDDSIFNGITWQCVLMGYGFGALVGIVLGILYL